MELYELSWKEFPEIDKICLDIAAQVEDVHEAQREGDVVDDNLLILAFKLAEILDRKTMQAFATRIDYATWSPSSRVCYSPASLTGKVDY